MKLFITGKTGQLGSSLVKDATELGHDVIAPTRKEFDVADSDKFKILLEEHRPDIVINTAAFLDVYLCEMEPENAFKYNCIFPIRMVEICNDLDIKFVFLSTDYIFSGLLSDGRTKRFPYDEDDPPSPLQMYGLSKLAGEYGTLSCNENSIIIRTCGLYGNRSDKESKGGKGNFVDNRLRDAQSNSKIEISNDQIVCPTFVDDLSKAALKLIEHPDAHGVYHLVNEGSCTWYEFTKEIFDILDISCEVVPVNRGRFYGGVRKPLFSVLKNKKASEHYNIILPYWKDGLKQYLKQQQYAVMQNTDYHESKN